MTTRLDDLLEPEEPDDTLVRGPSAGTGPRQSRDLDGDDGLFDDDEALLPPPPTSRLTLVLVALLILALGFVLGVQVDRVAGGGPPPRPGSAGALAGAGG